MDVGHKVPDIERASRCLDRWTSSQSRGLASDALGSRNRNETFHHLDQEARAVMRRR
jgi:hypothetical protein